MDTDLQIQSNVLSAWFFTLEWDRDGIKELCSSVLRKTCWLREAQKALITTWMRKKKKKRKDWVIPFNENDSKTRYNQLMSMKRYLAREKRSLPWRIIELKKLKKNWCIDFFFSGMQKISKNKSEWERLWLRWENKIIYPWENVMCTLAKRGVMAVQNEPQEPNSVSEQNKHGQQLVFSYIFCRVWT